jgi:hypothetical protein
MARGGMALTQFAPLLEKEGALRFLWSLIPFRPSIPTTLREDRRFSKPTSKW